MKASARRTAAVAAATTLALTLSPSAALAAGAKRVTQGNGTLQANGAAITLPSTFTCPAGYTAYLTAQVIQAIGEDFAAGYDTVAKQCTGERQKLTFYIQAVPAGDNTRPYQAGTASSRVLMDAVDPDAEQPYYDEAPAGQGEGDGAGDAPASPLPPLPPLTGAQYSTMDDPMGDPEGDPEGEETPTTVHAEARGPITLKEKAGS
jgi:hypothetical protein